MAAALIGSLISAGAGLWGQRKAMKEAESNREANIRQQTLAYERSLPYSTQGPAGSVEFDPETKQIMQNLSPEFKSLMDSFAGRSAGATEALAAMQNDPYAMEQEQFRRFEELNADAFYQQREQGLEQSLARGRSGTQGYYDNLAIEKAIGQQRLGGQLEAMNTGMGYRNMLSAEALGFAGGAEKISGMLRPDVEAGYNAPKYTNTTGNQLGVTDSISDYTTAANAKSAGLMTQAQEYDWDDLGQKLKNGYSMFSDAVRTQGIRSGTGFNEAQRGNSYAGKL